MKIDIGRLIDDHELTETSYRLILPYFQLNEEGTDHDWKSSFANLVKRTPASIRSNQLSLSDTLLMDEFFCQRLFSHLICLFYNISLQDPLVFATDLRIDIARRIGSDNSYRYFTYEDRPYPEQWKSVLTYIEQFYKSNISINALITRYISMEKSMTQSFHIDRLIDTDDLTEDSYNLIRPYFCLNKNEFSYDYVTTYFNLIKKTPSWTKKDNMLLHEVLDTDAEFESRMYDLLVSLFYNLSLGDEYTMGTDNLTGIHEERVIIQMYEYFIFEGDNYPEDKKRIFNYLDKFYKPKVSINYLIQQYIKWVNNEK